MKYITRTINRVTAHATLFKNGEIITEDVDVSECRTNDKIIEKYIENNTGAKLLEVKLEIEENLYRMPLKEFVEHAEKVIDYLDEEEEEEGN